MEREGPRALDAIQRRLWRLITDPDGVDAALAAEGDAGHAGLTEWVRGDRGLAAAERVAVYANAYFARLHDALREDFGALARALGAAAFHDLVKTYLMMHPPTRPSLRDAGAHLAEHLATEPFATIFARRCPYAGDLARLEWALVEAFDAADAAVLAGADLAAVPADAWAELRFRAVPSLRILTCAWPVQRVRERFEREEAEAVWDGAPELVEEPAHLRVWRQDERVHYRAMASLECQALRTAASGEPFGAVCGCVAAETGDAEAAARAAALLASWVSDGLLARSG
jgi:hypothetical protein